MNHSISNSSTTGTPQVQLATVFELGGVSFNGYFDNSGGETIVFAKTNTNENVDLIDIGKSLCQSKVQLPKELPLAFTDLLFSAKNGREFAFKAKTADRWEIIKGLSIHSGELDLNIIRNPIQNEKAFTGYIKGVIDLFDVETRVKVDIGEELTLSGKISEINIAKILSRYAPELTLPTEIPINNIVIKSLSIKAIPKTGEISFEGKATSKFQLSLGGVQVEIIESFFYFSRDKEGEISCSITVLGAGQFSDDLRFPKAMFKFNYNDNAWQLGGEIDLQIFDKKLNLKAEAKHLNGTNSISFISSGNLPSLHLPDVLKLTENENISSFTLRQFSFTLKQENGSITSWQIGGTSDFTLWNPVSKGEKLLEIESGKLELAGEGAQKSLVFIPGKAELKPLGIFPFLPEALKSGLTLGLGHLSLKKKQGIWNIESSAYLQIENDIFKDLPGAEAIGNLFSPPQQGEKRRIEGSLALSSKEGISITLINDAFALTPNPSDLLGKALEEMLKNLKVLLKDKPELQPLLDELNVLKAQLPDTGKIYFCLRKIALNLSNKPKFEVQLALGLPEKLNELLFSKLPAPLNKLQGIVTTYDPVKTDLSLMTATLELSEEDGISGSLGNFPPINWTKGADLLKEVSKDIKRVFADGITFITENGDVKKLTDAGIALEKVKSIVLDFDGIMGKPKNTYGAIAIDIPQIAYSFKSGDFTISGGCRVLSDQLSIPLPFQSLLLLLGLPEVAPYVTESIPIRSVSFIEEEKLRTDDLENYFIDCLPKKFREPAQLELFKTLLKPFKFVIEELGGTIVNRLPTSFKEYLGIHLPKGFRFDLSITADKSVNFSLEVISPVYKIEADHIATLKALPSEKQLSTALLQKIERLKTLDVEYENKPAVSRAIRRILSRNEWENHSQVIIKTITSGDFHDAIQTLVPVVQQQQIILVGIRLRRIAFGTALFNQVFRVDFSGEINVFDLLELVPSLMLPAPEEIADETLRLILPNRHQLQKTILLDQLVVFIIYYTGIPIPVPVYAKELSVRNVSLLGDEEELRWAVEANGGITTVLKKILQLKSFFSDESSWLPLQEYPMGSSMEAPELGLTLGPNYLKLPGIFGYEHDGHGNNKQEIAIGTTEPIDLNFFDLIGVGANTLKGMILQKNILTPSGTESAPLNYLIQYLPLEKRVGEKHIVLFHFFNVYAKWLLTTPQEFRDGAWKKLQGVQTKDELLSLIPLPSNASPNEEGFVAYFQGGFSIAEIAYFDTAFVMTASKRGMLAGFKMKGVLGDVMSSNLKGIAKIMPKNKENPVQIQGEGELIFCGKKVLDGKLMLNKEGLVLSGEIDLFPHSELIRITGKVDGVFQKNTFQFHGGVSCVFGPLTLAAAQLTISNEEFIIKSTFFNQTIILAMQQKGKSMRFFAEMTPMKIGDFLQITDASGQTGPIIYVELNQLNYEKTALSVAELRKAQTNSHETNNRGESTAKTPFFQNSSIDAWTPSGDQFKVYISGKLVILGLESSSHIIFTENHFLVQVKGSFLNLFSSELKVQGKMKVLDPLWQGRAEWLGGEDWSGDDTWQEMGHWQGEGKWLNSAAFDWKEHGVCTFTGSIDMLGTAFKSSGELNLGTNVSSGNIKLWVATNQANFFQDCELKFSYELSPTISKANLLINGDILEAALRATLNTVKVQVNQLVDGAVLKLEGFDRKVEESKVGLRSNAAERKLQVDRDYKFWKDKVDVLTNILNQSSSNQVNQFINQYFNEAQSAILNQLYKEKSGHSQWYYNGEYRHPWDWVAFKVKQKLLDDMIWHVNNSLHSLLHLANSLKPAFDVLYPIVQHVLNEILRASKDALKVVSDLRKTVIDTETDIALAALAIVQGATGFTRGFLLEAKNQFNLLHSEIDRYITSIPIKIVKASIDASLNQFQLNSFDATIELLVTPSDGKSVSKTVKTTIDFNDLTKTAKLFLEVNKDVLKLTELPELEDEMGLNTFSNNTFVFSDEKQFIQWLKEQSDTWLIERLNYFNEDKWMTLHSIYENAVDVEEDYSMYQIAGKLGEAALGLIELVAIQPNIKTGAEKKRFVEENIIYLSHLMDNGVNGNENNIHEHIQGFEFLADTNRTLQEAFVCPLINNAIESLWSHSNQYQN